MATKKKFALELKTIHGTYHVDSVTGEFLDSLDGYEILDFENSRDALPDLEDIQDSTEPEDYGPTQPSSVADRFGPSPESEASGSGNVMSRRTAPNDTLRPMGSRKDVTRSKDLPSKLAGVPTGMAMAGVGAALGSVAGPIGTMAGGLLGSLAGRRIGGFVVDDMRQNPQTMAQPGKTTKGPQAPQAPAGKKPRTNPMLDRKVEAVTRNVPVEEVVRREAIKSPSYNPRASRPDQMNFESVDSSLFGQPTRAPQPSRPVTPTPIGNAPPAPVGAVSRSPLGSVTPPVNLPASPVSDVTRSPLAGVPDALPAAPVGRVARAELAGIPDSLPASPVGNVQSTPLAAISRPSSLTPSPIGDVQRGRLANIPSSLAAAPIGAVTRNALAPVAPRNNPLLEDAVVRATTYPTPTLASEDRPQEETEERNETLQANLRALESQNYNAPKSYSERSAQDFLGDAFDDAPLGMTANNPGNLKYTGSSWQNANLPGIVGPTVHTDQGDPQIDFSSPEAGMAAAARLAVGKYDEGMTTLQDIIAGPGGWTPGAQYAVNNIARTLNIEPTDDLALRTDEGLKGFLGALARQEHGPMAAQYYTPDMWDTAVKETLYTDSLGVPTPTPRDSVVNRQVMPELDYDRFNAKAPSVNWGRATPDDIDPYTRGRLEEAQSMLDFSINVTSGYRDKATNTKVGGARNSQHVHGRAVDISLKDLDEDQRADLVSALGRVSEKGKGRIGAYSGNTGLHYDTAEHSTQNYGGLHPMYDTTIQNMEKAPSWFSKGLKAVKDKDYTNLETRQVKGFNIPEEEDKPAVGSYNPNFGFKTESQKAIEEAVDTAKKKGVTDEESVSKFDSFKTRTEMEETPEPTNFNSSLTTGYAGYAAPTVGNTLNSYNSGGFMGTPSSYAGGYASVGDGGVSYTRADGSTRNADGSAYDPWSGMRNKTGGNGDGGFGSGTMSDSARDSAKSGGGLF